jgi:hypothetical protein
MKARFVWVLVTLLPYLGLACGSTFGDVTGGDGGSLDAPRSDSGSPGDQTVADTHADSLEESSAESGSSDTGVRDALTFDASACGSQTCAKDTQYCLILYNELGMIERRTCEAKDPACPSSLPCDCEDDAAATTAKSGTTLEYSCKPSFGSVHHRCRIECVPDTVDAALLDALGFDVIMAAPPRP